MYNEFEYYHGLRELGFTESGALTVLQIRRDYQDLFTFYDEFVGNFGFTETEVKEHYASILKWLSTHEDYKLIYQNLNNEDDEPCYWLTDFE